MCAILGASPPRIVEEAGGGSPGGGSQEEQQPLVLAQELSGRKWATVTHTQRSFVLCTGEEVWVWVGREVVQLLLPAFFYFHNMF